MVTESGNATIVHVTIKHQKLSDLEMLIEKGLKENFTSALKGLTDFFYQIQFNLSLNKIERQNNEALTAVTYWKDLESIQKWRDNPEHQVARRK